MNKIYMLDTNIYSFIMREQPEAVLFWDRAAVDATTEIKIALRLAGAVLVTNNIRVFARMLGLTLDVLNQSKPVLIIFYLEQFFNRFCRVEERVTVFFL